VEAGGRRRGGWAVSRLAGKLSGALLALGLLGAALAPTAPAAAPTIAATWASIVQANTARLNAEVDPGAKATTYRFEYLTRSAYEANVAGAKAPFTGASKLPPSGETGVPGTAPTTIGPLVSLLAPATAYRYRLTVKNADGTTVGPTREFTTHANTVFALPDNRGWEMVSPVEKNGGQVSPPGALAGGGVLAAAADGQAVTYGSAASFAGGSGAPPASQYLALRGAGGWSTLNLTSPVLAGSYGTVDEGVPFQLFSADLARGLLANGRPCRGEASGCPVANPPLAGTDAVPGYRNYYLRSSASASHESLLGPTDLTHTDLHPTQFDLTLAGATPDLAHTVLATCAGLTADATEVALGEGCDPAKPNLYRHFAGNLTLINAAPGAALAAQSGAISSDGSRVYFKDLTSGDLHLRAGATVKQVDATAGGGGAFQTATADGAIAFFTVAGHLWRYEAVADTATDLTPAGEVLGVLGISANASHLYYLTTSGLFLRAGATTVKVADAADPSNYPPATGTARIAADGNKALFLSSAPLSGYDNLNATTKAPEPQVFLYDAAGAGTLTCLSCNPTNSRPTGPSTIPGATKNGTAPASTHSYKPRALSADGRRVFFETSDSLVLADVNLDNDVYEWEAPGKGSCAIAAGCLSLISSGLADSARLIDASVSGDDVFFTTDRSLIGADPGSVDLYDARVGGGFPEPTDPLPCNGDACQNVPEAPEDPVLTTVLSGPGNPPERYRTYGASAKCPQGKVRKKGKCVKKKGKGKGAKAKRGRGR